MNARQEGLAGDAPLPVSHLSTIAFQQVRPMGAVCTTAHLSAMPDPATGGVFDENSRERRRMDYVVDRFIAYDIGKLKGKAGMEAQRDFDQLGPEAIPALVDGLNRSAGLRQSCPVGVISRKLECALRETDDPAMIAYALENIGRGVPDNAPHADRLRGRKQRWTAEFLRRRETIQANLQALGLPEDDLLVEKVRQLSVAEDAEVEQALRDPDLRVRLASAVALGLRGRTGGKDGATVAGHVLVDALDDDDPLVRRIAQFNLTQLTGGSDLGENKQAWLDYWDIVERAERAGSSLPVKLVDGLDHAEWPVRREAVRAVAKVSDRLPAGQRGKVGERLTALLVDARPEIKRAAKEALVTLAHGHDACVGAPADGLPAQRAAVRWREYWQQYRQELEAEPRAESLFLMACRLEESGREEMADKRFRQIADEYPDTTAAARSRDRLDPVR
jgi:hypothetical protein